MEIISKRKNDKVMILVEEKPDSKKRQAVVLSTEKKLVHESEDSDFETREKKRRKKKQIKKHFDTIRNRCSPGALLSVIQGFNEVQKDCVKDMGFGDLLKMKMTEVPGALSCFVLEKFDLTTKKIILQRGKIDVTRESVHQILGFPLGRKKFSELPFRTTEDNTYEEWTQQFENKSMIRLQEIKMKIVSSNKVDMNFRMNFLALLINSLIESSSSGKANTSPLKYIMKDTKISNIDWCSYLIDCLVKTKQSYDPSSSTSNFVGPSAYLVLVYVDSVHSEVIQVERTRPVICHWTSEKMKLRESYEKEELGDFGTGEFNEEFVERDLNEEDYEEMVLMKYKKLHLLTEKGIDKFPENITLNHLKVHLDTIFDDENEYDNKEKENDNIEGSNEDEEEYNDGIEGGGKSIDNVWRTKISMNDMVKKVIMIKKKRMLKEERWRKEY
ncbi:unnamed protein product [Lactuca saligna]|uniref:Uncharacterized protein n=1 Tax=Lactuca saligna TaxID=75948 RepID=A0AA35YR83_LACSI|nr:unnamed protein product [Lactuca saligna]